MKLQGADGKLTTGDVLTIFGTEAQEADARAFKTLMQHLQEIAVTLPKHASLHRCPTSSVTFLRDTGLALRTLSNATSGSFGNARSTKV
jgi:hypothetical protein